VGWKPSEDVGGLSDVDVVRFLAEPWNARIATVDAGGWPHVTPVWYEYDADERAFLIVGRAGAAWVDHLRREPRVAVHVADDAHAEHTRVLVRGRAAIVAGPVAPALSERLDALTRRLSVRYLGPDGPTYAARTADRPRVLVRVAAETWRTWTGREWHPRYR
jgi:PPOX class probable F420-dependent enzyme